MAIKVSGTTVIDDSRNLQNTVNVNATGNVYANTFIGDGSSLTGISAGATVTDKSDDVNYNIVFTSETSGTQALAGIDNGAFTFNPNSGRVTATSYAGDGSALTGVSAGATVTDKSDNVSYNIVFTSETSGTQSLAGIDDGAFTFNPSTGVCSAAVFTATSDERAKENIETISDALNKVSALNGVDFTWKSNGDASSGLIAQQVEEVMPHVVVTDGDGMKSVNYGALVGVLVQAIKELNDKLES